jgi:hypothetical protein
MSSRRGAWWIKPRDIFTFVLHTFYDGIYGEHWYKMVLLTSIYRQGFSRAGRGHSRIDPSWIEMILIRRYAVKADAKWQQYMGILCQTNDSACAASWWVRLNRVRHTTYWPTFAIVKLPRILRQRCFEETQKCHGTDGKLKSFDVHS